MAQVPAVRRFPGWLRRCGWCGLCVLGVVCLGILGFRVLMWRVHRKAVVVVESYGRSRPPLPLGGVGKGRADRTPSLGTKLSDVPHLGATLAGDDVAGLEDFAAALESMRGFLGRCGQPSGAEPVDFRALLAKLGINLPAGATEAEVAAAFLREAGAFATLLDDWRAAVSSGAWEVTDLDGRVSVLSTAFSLFPRLLRLMAEAQWQSGDSAAAWGSVSLMALTVERAFDIPQLHCQSAAYASSGALAETLASGVSAGGWSDDHLRSVPRLAATLDPLAHLPGYAEGAKRTLDLWSASAGSPSSGRPVTLDVTDPVQSVISLAHGTLDSSRQRELDNFSLIKALFDADAASFDYSSRTLLPAADRKAFDPVAGLQDSGVFSQLYFAPALHHRSYEEESPLGKVVTAQSQVDHAVIAARLELEKRAAGAYPDQLPDGLPHDVATGQPYRYQRLPDGGYRLWGVGLDQSDQGGDGRSDVVWPAGRSSHP